MYVGLGCGCLFLLIVGGGVGFWYWSASQVESLVGDAAARTQMFTKLNGVKLQCDLESDPGQYFHADVASEMKDPACRLTDATIDKLNDTQASTLEPLPDTGSSDKAEDLGLDPAKCHRLSAGSASVIGCQLDSDEYKLIHVENLDAF